MRVLAALLYLPSSTYLLLPGNAAFALRPSALRKVSGDAIMTTLGGARATTYSYNPPVLGAPASILGQSSHGAQVTGLRPFFPCPYSPECVERLSEKVP